MRRLKCVMLAGVLALLLNYSPSLYAAPMSAGFNVGLVSPEHLFTTIGGGGLLDWAFDLGPSGSIHFQPTIEFWYSHNDRYYYYWDRWHWDYPWSVFELSLNANGRYFLPVPRSTPVKPFLGLGLAFDFPNFHYDYIDQDPDHYPYYYNDHFFIDYNAFVGITFKMSRNAEGFVEIRGKMGYIGLSKLLFGMTFPLGRS